MPADDVDDAEAQAQRDACITAAGGAYDAARHALRMAAASYDAGNEPAAVAYMRAGMAMARAAHAMTDAACGTGTDDVYVLPEGAAWHGFVTNRRRDIANPPIFGHVRDVMPAA